MIVRISPTHPFRLAFDTIVVEGGGSDNTPSEVEAVAEAVADAVEEVAEAVAEATTGDLPSEWVERIVNIEHAVEALGLSVAELEGRVITASIVAQDAAETAEEATTPDEVEAMIEDTVISDTDGDGTADVVDAPDEPPTGVGRSLLFASGKEIKDRLFRKGE